MVILFFWRWSSDRDLSAHNVCITIKDEKVHHPWVPASHLVIYILCARKFCRVEFRRSGIQKKWKTALSSGHQEHMSQKCDSLQLKGSSRCRRGGLWYWTSSIWHRALWQNDYNFLTTSKCWFKIGWNGEWYSCLACTMEIMTGTHQNDVFHNLRTLVDCKYCPKNNAGVDKWVCWSDANIASK